jgi:hypothetical protein
MACSGISLLDFIYYKQRHCCKTNCITDTATTQSRDSNTQHHGTYSFSLIVKKMTAFWDVAPCSPVEVDRRVKRRVLPPSSKRWSAFVIVLMMEAVCTSETSVCFHETKRRYFSRSCIHTLRRKNMKSHDRNSLSLYTQDFGMFSLTSEITFIQLIINTQKMSLFQLCLGKPKAKKGHSLLWCCAR